MKIPFLSQKSLEKASADWVLRLDRGLTDREEDELARWLKDNPGGKELMEKYERVMDKFEALRLADVESLIRLDSGLYAPVLETARWLKVSMLVAAVSAILAVGYYSGSMFLGSSDKKAEIILATLRSVDSDFYELSDGSTLELNENTEVDYRYTENSRDFWVKSGESYFTVAKDPMRPFNVYVYDSRIQALGTQFNVKFQEELVEVVVTEGTVSVASRNADPDDANVMVEEGYANAVSQNQRTVIYPHNGQPSFPVDLVTMQEIDQKLAWKPVTLRFSETPLKEVVAAFNDYNTTQMIIADKGLNDVLIDVTFRSNKVEGFVRLIEATHQVVASRQGERIYLYERQ